MADKDAATPRVYLIRHGETEWSRNGRYTGSSDLPLLPEGESRVRQTASAIIGPGRLIDPSRLLKVYCSPRQRAVRTLELLLDQPSSTNIDLSNPASAAATSGIGHSHDSGAGRSDNNTYGGIDTEITEQITEWHYGDYEGLKTREILELRKSRGHDRDRKWDLWRDGAEGPGAELPDQVAARVDEIITQITEVHGRFLNDVHSGRIDQWNGKRDILIIAHGHILRAFVKRWLNVPLQNPLELMLEPGGVCGLSYAHESITERAVLVGMSFPQPL